MFGLNHDLKKEIKFFYEEMYNPELLYAETVLKKRSDITPEEQLLASRIRKAFSGVTSINAKRVLYGAFAFDDLYDSGASEAFFNWLAKQEERYDWQAIPPAQILALNVCLTYLEAESFRFLAPAYMCFSLEYEPSYPVASWLSFFGVIDSNPGYAEDYYDLFTDEQRQCTQDCINLWRTRWIDATDDKLSITIALLPWEFDDYKKNYSKSYSIFKYLKLKNKISIERKKEHL